jgi:hypothetical protein
VGCHTGHTMVRARGLPDGNLRAHKRSGRWARTGRHGLALWLIIGPGGWNSGQGRHSDRECELAEDGRDSETGSASTPSSWWPRRRFRMKA